MGSILASVAGATGAPAVKTSTVWAKSRRWAAGALTSVLSTMGAPPKWVTPSSAMASKMAGAVMSRQQTSVPPRTGIIQVWHQPLQ